MKGTFATLALAGAAAAAPYAGHAQFHEKKDVASDMVSDLMTEVNSLMTDAVNVLTKMGAKAAVNSLTPTANSWVGKATTGNAVVNTIVNNAGKDAYFACWAEKSWVNDYAPTVAVMVPNGKNMTISHAIAQGGATNTGACAPVFNDTELVNGQISQSWLEFNWLASEYGSSTFDLSMEVNMQGHNMSIVADKCTSDLNRCSFHCVDPNAKSCMAAGSYTLKNCAAGSQVGATAGQWGGADSGGCQGIANTGITNIKTILHPN